MMTTMTDTDIAPAQPQLAPGEIIVPDTIEGIEVPCQYKRCGARAAWLVTGECPGCRGQARATVCTPHSRRVLLLARLGYLQTLCCEDVSGDITVTPL